MLIDRSPDLYRELRRNGVDVRRLDSTVANGPHAAETHASGGQSRATAAAAQEHVYGSLPGHSL